MQGAVCRVPQEQRGCCFFVKLFITSLHSLLSFGNSDVFGSSKQPGNKLDHVLPQDADSRKLRTAEASGDYVYVVDESDDVHVLPQQRHGHPVVLGTGSPALYAGELTIDLPGSISEVNNLSGSFKFRSKRSLCCLAQRLRLLGFQVGELVWWPPDGSSRPARLACDPNRGYA